MSFASRPFDIFNTHPSTHPSSTTTTGTINPFRGRKLEYLFEDVTTEAYGPSWGARIMYGAGTTYTACLAIGGIWGTIDGLRSYRNIVNTSLKESSIKPNKRLLWNGIVNSSTTRGPFLGNNVAMLAFMYNGIHGALLASLPDSTLSSLNKFSLLIPHLAKVDFKPLFVSKNEDDSDITIINRHGNWISSVISASLAGAIWKGSHGIPTMLRTSSICGISAIAFNLLRNKI